MNMCCMHGSEPSDLLFNNQNPEQSVKVHLQKHLLKFTPAAAWQYLPFQLPGTMETFQQKHAFFLNKWQEYKWKHNSALKYNIRQYLCDISNILIFFSFIWFHCASPFLWWCFWLYHCTYYSTKYMQHRNNFRHNYFHRTCSVFWAWPIFVSFFFLQNLHFLTTNNAWE